MEKQMSIKWPGATEVEFDLLKFMEEEMAKSLEIARKKNADYTGSSTVDPFANFTAVQTLGIKPEIGFLTRMMDKLKRVSTFVERGTLEVSDETVADTLRDLSNYSLLFLAYLEWKKAKATIQ